MNVQYDIAVIGGGAAGMLAAIKAAEAGGNVVVIEKKSSCGRKVLITGKGRCNITNTKSWAEFSSHIHPKANFIKSAFYNFSNKDTVHFFNKIGLPTVVTQGQRVFPESMSAASVVDVLVARMASLGIDIFYNSDIVKIMRVENAYRCIYNRRIGDMLNIQAINASAVIVATGGLSYPLTGSTGKGYDIARSFEHTV
ncbi:MAG: aminoacetone oxidase family FAD-binding enzyme, partial [Bacteroidales bacterium]|nr:aminoacetone oxidase family FAD-binding enzyme [Bacteroidales bacterium]